MTPGQQRILSVLALYLSIGFSGIFFLFYVPVTNNTGLSAIPVISSVPSLPSEPQVPAARSRKLLSSTDRPLFFDKKGTPVYHGRSYTFQTITFNKNLHLRQYPDLSAPIMARLKPGEAGVVLKPGRKWSFVSYNGLKGYLYNDYLNFYEKNEDNKLFQ